MPRVRTLLGVSALLFSTLACVTIMGASPASQSNHPGPPITEAPVIITQAPAESVTCPALTNRIIKVATSVNDLAGESTTSGEETTLATYSVTGNKIVNPVYPDVRANLRDLQNDTSTQQNIWSYFVTLIPLQARQALAEYTVMTDGTGNTLAAVSQTDFNPKLWNLEIDIADTNNTYDFTYTLLHEFGHLLTLGPNQVPPSIAVFNNPDNNEIYLQAAAACPDYFPGEGCAKPDSYINAFYNQFWTGIYDEWNAINLEENDDKYYAKLDAFYRKYRDQFITDYAPTNPEEDIAESWTFFVLGPKPAGDTIAEKKILFFYQYPGLIDLRKNILSNLCTAFPKQ